LSGLERKRRNLSKGMGKNQKDLKFCQGSQKREPGGGHHLKKGEGRLARDLCYGPLGKYPGRPKEWGEKKNECPVKNRN